MSLLSNVLYFLGGKASSTCERKAASRVNRGEQMSVRKREGSHGALSSAAEEIRALENVHEGHLLNLSRFIETATL